MNPNIYIKRFPEYKCNKRYVQVKRVMFDGGYATFSEAGVPGWHYFLCDHAGSVRVVADMWGRAEPTNHYYPYGLIHNPL